MRFAESEIEQAALGWLAEPGIGARYGPDLAAGMLGAERADPNFRDVVLEGRLRQALERLNPSLPPEGLDDALRKLMRVEAATLAERKRAVHRMLVDGVTVEYRRRDGSIAGSQARGIDFEEPEDNDWLVVHPITVVEGQHERWPDVVILVNGLPLAGIEIDTPMGEKVTEGAANPQRLRAIRNLRTIGP